MGKLIAVAGKGGTGKTTVASLVVRHLLATGRTPVLAVDADPNHTLGEALGIEVGKTLGSMREEFFGERAKIPAGMSKQSFLERQLHASVIESQGMDLLVMGRQEGPGCYCFLNNVLRRFLDTLTGDYAFAVIDNEAGMEHLSRRNTRKIDLLLLVSDQTVKAVRAIGRIAGLAEELELDVRQKLLVLNRSAGADPAELTLEIERIGLPVAARLPVDEALQAADARGHSLLALPGGSPAMAALQDLLDRCLDAN
ncbi:MAG: AAA family ATPase [Deltaproteobacteria bacterium]|nr:AAA family ATPase [Deltaproteobacteria bacterium]